MLIDTRTVVHIRYANGAMELYPDGFFEDGQGVAYKFPKICELSARSDYLYGTHALDSWRQGIKDEHNKIFQLSERLAKQLEAEEQEMLSKQYIKPARKQRAIEAYKRRCKHQFKLLDNRKKRCDKCSVTLERIADKYGLSKKGE